MEFIRHVIEVQRHVNTGKSGNYRNYPLFIADEESMMIQNLVGNILANHKETKSQQKLILEILSHHEKKSWY